jgi:predicted kinase
VQPLLIAIGGLSGSGKTSLAAALQPVIPNTVHLDSDRTRKEIFGVPATTRLPKEAYSPEATHRLVAEMTKRVKENIASGKNVIVSAAFLPPESRAEEEKLAHETGARFIGIWLQADMNALLDRVSKRVGDASDATADILKMQVAEGTGAITWPVIDAGLSREDILKAALKLVEGGVENLHK